MELIERLIASRDRMLPLFDLTEPKLSQTYKPGKWSVQVILHHITDTETVYYDRIRRVLCEPHHRSASAQNPKRILSPNSCPFFPMTHIVGFPGFESFLIWPPFLLAGYLSQADDAPVADLGIRILQCLY
jgi:hypothetical protein